jgi:hypothetical protein
MEDFGYLKEEKAGFPLLLKKVFLLSATLFSIACFIYITIHAYKFVYGDDNQTGEIETIKSPEEPIKVVEGEGEIKENDNNKKSDDSIYDDIFGNKKESLAQAIPKIHLAPEPPKKVDPFIIHEGSLANINNVKSTENKNPNQKIVVYADKKDENPSYDLLTKNKIEEKKEVKTQEIRKKTASKNLIKVQIAALTSKGAADEYWKKLNNIDPNLFSELKLFTEKIDLGKRGIFYRVQIGNFSTQTEADEFCNNYISRTKKSRADCILVE